MKKWNLDKVSAGWRHVLCCLVWMLMAAQAVQAQDAVPLCPIPDRVTAGSDTLPVCSMRTDTIAVPRLTYPAAFRQLADNVLTDSLGIRHLYLSLPNTVRLSSLRGCVLQVEASRGCLGWERVHRITPLLRAVPDSSGLHSSSPYPASAAGADTSFPASDSSERASPDSLTTKKLPAFTYTKRDIRIFALLRGIDLKDTSRVCVQRLRMGVDSFPVWQLGVLRADKEGRMRRIRIHGQTGEVLSDTLLSAVACHRH